MYPGILPVINLDLLGRPAHLNNTATWYIYQLKLATAVPRGLRGKVPSSAQTAKKRDMR